MTEAMAGAMTDMTEKGVSAGQSNYGAMTVNVAPVAMTYATPFRRGAGVHPVSHLDYLACNKCGEEYLAQVIENGRGKCPECGGR